MTSATAVLFSAGLDSAVLAASAARNGRVQPIYVRAGLAWEAEEQAMAARLLASAPYSARVLPLVTLTVDMRDVYPAAHWAVAGHPPAFDTPDEEVYIDGRNIVLLSKASVYMARHGIARVLMGTLADNPFPDASAAFFDAMGSALSTGLGKPIAIEAPLATMHKVDVLRLGLELGVPMELTLSCMQPSGGRHCGACSKCRERRDAFLEAGVDDPTVYGVKPAR
ncbi:MAG TPA: 7-cyano-7-deazaguanine synthase [Vicinamibacterales bacterium]|nr:7-cyano-7-deazaguanine synthase [Vicinamibacterales bacterium]